MQVSTWPEHAVVESTTAWAADGRRSIRVPDGVLAAVDVGSATDWTGFDLLRVHVKAPADGGCGLLFQIKDAANGYHNFHLRPAAAAAGESVVDIDIGGELWRGEANRPYREIKTPLDKHRIERVGITPLGATMYVDRFELVRIRPPAAPGGWAFDFGGDRTPVGAGWTGVFPGTTWDPARGYGFTGTPRAFGKAVPYPTVVMGDGLIFGDAEFSVTLAGGAYTAWAVFDRSGFWEGEQAVYTKARLVINGRVVSTHASSPAAPWFAFEDTEILTQADVIEQLVMPAAGEAAFTFTAVPGRNRIALTVERPEGEGEPPRLAGLVLAPATGPGRAFVAAHRATQRESAGRAHRVIGGLAPEKAPRWPAAGKMLATGLLPVDHVMTPAEPPPTGHPGDRGLRLHGFAGTTRQALLGVWAVAPVTLTATLGPIRAGQGQSGTRLADGTVAVWVNRYLPVREFEMTACRIETHHYEPMRPCPTGPGCPRAVLVRVRIPPGTTAGNYFCALTLAWAGAGGRSGSVTVPMVVSVEPVDSLPPLDLPFGLFFTGPPIPKAIAGDALWWRLAESMMDLEADTGLTLLAGGPDWDLHWEKTHAVYGGDDALRYVALAHAHGLDRAMTNYGGLSLGAGSHGIEAVPDGMAPAAAAAEMARAWKAFSDAHHLPPYLLYAYDEPSTPSEFDGVVDRLKLYKAAGFRTIGYTSLEDPAHVDENHRALARETTSPAYGEHTPATLAWAKAQGAAPWVYNNGLGRYEAGVHLWRMRRAGAKGRIEWIGAIVQGFQYDTLDSREPDPSCFFVHDRLGALFSPRYLGLCEGVYDARLLIALEAMQQQRPSSAGGIGPFLAGLEAIPYRTPLTHPELDAVRAEAELLLRTDGGAPPPFDTLPPAVR